MKHSVVLTLNIVSNEPERVFNALHNFIEGGYYDMHVTLKNRVSINITEIEITSTQRCCLSFETIHELLYWIPDYDIRIIVG